MHLVLNGLHRFTDLVLALLSLSSPWTRSMSFGLTVRQYNTRLVSGVEIGDRRRRSIRGRRRGIAEVYLCILIEGTH